MAVGDLPSLDQGDVQTRSADHKKEAEARGRGSELIDRQDVSGVQQKFLFF
jgi:hypothetical protein